MGHQSTAKRATTPHTITVHRGDTLWDIADHKLHDPHRWRDIYTLNWGHEQANGYALTDPGRIVIEIGSP